MKFSNLLTVIIFIFCIPFQTFCQLNYKYESLPCLNKKFSILAHVTINESGDTEITEETISGAIDSLNNFFEPICVSFEICAFDTISNWQFNELNDNDEWQDMQVKYHKANRINMFFVADTQLPNACGFAGLGGINNLESGGIVIQKIDCVGPGIKTIPHEMGHYFGLVHTFVGNGDELVNGANCDTAGDNICDTPADPFVEGDDVALYVDVGEGCRFISPKLDANGEYYRPDVGNIMSYYPNTCRCGFTHQQYLKMAETGAISTMW